MATALPETRVHDWGKWTLTNVGVIVDPETGFPHVVDLVDTAVGEQVACLLCGEPLNNSSAVSLCEGSTE